MKTTIKSVCFAMFFTIALLFSFKNADAQYARIERQVNSFYSGPTSAPGYVSEDYLVYDFYVRFYADAACTIPATVGAGLTVDYQYIMYYDEALNYGGTGDVVNTTTSTVSEMYLGTAYDHDLYYDSYGTAWGMQAALGSAFYSGTGSSTIVSKGTL